MTVHARESTLRLIAMIFEARYDEGYRYLDRSGEIIVRIRRHKPAWVVAGLAQQFVQMQLAQHKLVLNIGTEKLDLSVSEPLDLAEAEKRTRVLGQEAEDVYQTVVEVLSSPNTTRVGVRFGFLAPADSLEDADRFVAKTVKSPLLDAVLNATKGELWDAMTAYQVYNPDSKLRHKLQLLSAIVQQKPGEGPYMGFPGDPGTGGVVVDIDSYTRPEKGHFAKPSVFIQEAYLRSRRTAIDLFNWLLEHQKAGLK